MCYLVSFLTFDWPWPLSVFLVVHNLKNHVVAHLYIAVLALWLQCIFYPALCCWKLNTGLLGFLAKQVQVINALPATKLLISVGDVTWCIVSSGLEAMKSALAIKRASHEAFNNLHQIADQHQDFDVSMSSARGCNTKVAWLNLTWDLISSYSRKVAKWLFPLSVC